MASIPTENSTQPTSTQPTSGSSTLTFDDRPTDCLLYTSPSPRD